jgi:6-phospho-3-hexuloisomerase
LTGKTESQAGTPDIRKALETILEENRRLLEIISNEAAEDFIQRIMAAKSIFFSAQGRSGFILRCFCMRLMHLGFLVYFCGETITPAIDREDLLVVLSGSGETSSTIESVKIAKKKNATTYGILGNMESGTALLVDKSIHLPGTTKLCRDHEPESSQMAGALFEQSAFLFFEAMIQCLFHERKEAVGRVSPRHAVIE